MIDQGEKGTEAHTGVVEVEEEGECHNIKPPSNVSNVIN